MDTYIRFLNEVESDGTETHLEILSTLSAYFLRPDRHKKSEGFYVTHTIGCDTYKLPLEVTIGELLELYTKITNEPYEGDYRTFTPYMSNFGYHSYGSGDQIIYKLKGKHFVSLTADKTLELLKLAYFEVYNENTKYHTKFAKKIKSFADSLLV